MLLDVQSYWIRIYMMLSILICLLFIIKNLELLSSQLTLYFSEGSLLESIGFSMLKTLVGYSTVQILVLFLLMM